MKPLLLATAAWFCISAGTAYAHGVHGVLTAEKAQQVAVRTVQKMTFKDFGHGKLDSSWRAAASDQANIVGRGDGFYVIAVQNPQSDKQMFVKISDAGVVEQVSDQNTF